MQEAAVRTVWNRSNKNNISASQIYSNAMHTISHAGTSQYRGNLRYRGVLRKDSKINKDSHCTFKKRLHANNSFHFTEKVSMHWSHPPLSPSLYICLCIPSWALPRRVLTQLLQGRRNQHTQPGSPRARQPLGSPRPSQLVARAKQKLLSKIS